jgi:hypothetical protein
LARIGMFGWLTFWRFKDREAHARTALTELLADTEDLMARGL